MGFSLENITSPQHTKKESTLKKSFGSKELFVSKKLGAKFKESLYSELALLLEAGLDILDALEIVKEQFSKTSELETLDRIKRELITGSLFYESLQETCRFTTYEIQSVRIGEETGHVILVLKKLGDYFKSQIENKRAIVSALTYPAIVMFTAMMAVGFMMLYMVPLFKDIFKRVNGELPTITQWVISVSENSGFILITGIVLITSTIFLHRLLRNNLIYLDALHNAMLKIPVIGGIIKNRELLKMMQSMHLLTGAKMPLNESLDLQESMIEFIPLKKAIHKIKKGLLLGESMYYSMQDIPLFSNKMISLIKVGEESNQLEFVLAKLTNQEEAELNYRLKVLGTTLEPFIIIILGGVVAVILISMYLPMFSLSSGMG